MRLLTLASSIYFLASIAFATENSPELFSHRPFERRGVSPEPGAQKMNIVMGKDVFEVLTDIMAVAIPNKINEIRIPETAMKGTTNTAPTSMKVPIYFGTNYAFSNIWIKGACMNRNAVKLGHNVIDFDIDFDATLVADYYLSTQLINEEHENEKLTLQLLVYKGYQKEYEGKMNVRLHNVAVTGSLTLIRDEVNRGILIHADHIKSDIRDVNVNIEDMWWREWMGTLFKTSVKHILTKAISDNVGLSVPDFLSQLLFKNAIRDMDFADGRKVESLMDVVEGPVITPDQLTFAMNLRIKYHD